LCLLSLSLKAQQISFDQITNLPVSGLKNPWAGGFNSVQFFSIDLDEDGKQDLVVFDRSAQHLKTFLKNAYGGFTYSPGYQKRFPLIENWMNLLDYDGDGDKDLFTSTPGGIQVYPNLNNYFPKSTGTLKSTGLNGLINIYVSATDIPAIADMDGDGDLDILAFESAGHFITYYENTGDLKYVTKSLNWGNFYLNDCQDIAFNVVPESILSTQSTEAVQHAGNTLALWDPDKNSIFDLIIGHVGCPGFIYLKNEGTRDKPLFRAAEENFPAGAPHVVPSLASGSPIAVRFRSTSSLGRSKL
ncbi:MAG: FG-GAP repeat domain-containing protein, partial [Aquirufa sp.]